MSFESEAGAGGVSEPLRAVCRSDLGKRRKAPIDPIERSCERSLIAVETSRAMARTLRQGTKGPVRASHTVCLRQLSLLAVGTAAARHGVRTWRSQQPPCSQSLATWHVQASCLALDCACSQQIPDREPQGELQNPTCVDYGRPTQITLQPVSSAAESVQRLTRNPEISKPRNERDSDKPARRPGPYPEDCKRGTASRGRCPQSVQMCSQCAHGLS